MLIQCTKKLLDELKIKPEPHAEEEALFSWHANLMTINRRKTIVMTNDSNRYVIVLHGLKAKDFTKLPELLVQGIRESFQNESIKDEVIEQFLGQAKEVSFTKTKDRTSVARLNKACEYVHFMESLLDSGTLIQREISARASRFLYGSGKNQYIHPNEELYKDLKAFSGQPIISAKVAEILVTLDLENHHVWRRLVVPVNRTFRQLHEILQTSFGWQNAHLHEFYLYDPETNDSTRSWNHSGYHKEGYKPILNLVADHEAFAYENDVPMQFDTECKLSEYLSAKIKYNYDFGDNWQHYIEVVKVTEDFEQNHPVCLEGEGNTPPEDVGGEGGYEEFLKIISDPSHPEHKHFINWSIGQGYRDFDLEKVNRMLK